MHENLKTSLYEKKLEYNNMLFDNQNNIVFVTSHKTGLISANKKFFKTFHFSNLEDFKIKHLCLSELFIDKDGFLPKKKELNDEYYWINIILKYPDREHKILIKDINNIIITYKVQLASIDFNNETLMIISLTDITELDKSRELAEASEKLKSAFMANMSHEIRTPMNGIFGFTKLLKDSPLNPEQQRFLKLIEHSTHTLLNIIDDILDFSKIESGKLELDFSHVNPFIELRNSIDIFSSKAREKNIEYRIYIDPKVNICLVMDHLRLSQVLSNLINNALKFTSATGSIDVRIETLESKDVNSQRVKFSVSDNGIGIPKHRIQSIFQSFIQADSSTTRNFGGTGLGLSISSSLCELMGSQLKVTSEEGKGSCFYFEIEFLKCNASETLNSQIINPPIYLINTFSQKIDDVILQLEHFELEFTLIEFDKLMTLRGQEHIVIAFELEECQMLVKHNYHVIFISELTENSQILTNDSIYHIESFSKYPSELYNAILDLNYLATDKETKIIKIRLNILIAEDYEINRILINEMLMKYDIKPDFAMNGEEAIEMAKDGDYDLILMDINMPKMNGVDATAALRKLGISIPIIALTANALEGDKEYFFSKGMNDYISKPINPKVLHDFLLKYSKDKNMLINNDDSEMCSIDQILESLRNAKKIMRFNNAIITRLFTSFVNSSHMILEELEEAIKSKDKDKIKEKMHALRGMLLSLEIRKLAKTCENIEYDKNELDEKTFMRLSQKVYDCILFFQEKEYDILKGIKELD